MATYALNLALSQCRKQSQGKFCTWAHTKLGSPVQNIPKQTLTLHALLIFITLPKFNSEFSTEKLPKPNTKGLSSFQPPFFRGELLNFGGVSIHINRRVLGPITHLSHSRMDGGLCHCRGTRLKGRHGWSGDTSGWSGPH